MCVLLPLQGLSKIFLILRRTGQDMFKNVYWSSREVPLLFLSDFNENQIFLTIFRKTLKHQIVWKSVQSEPSCSMRTDGGTDRHDDSRFSQFCKRV